MSFLQQIYEAASGYIAKVTSDGRLKVDLETNAGTYPKQVPCMRMFSENDPGDGTSAPYLKSPETSSDYRMRVGVDTVLFNDTFNASAQNTGIWQYVLATLTAAQPGAGTVNFSAVQGTTSSHGAFMRTWQYFPLVNTAPLAVEFTWAPFTANLVSGEVWLAGLGLPTAATTRPTDGVFFRLTSAGLVGVIAFNGTEVESGVLVAGGGIELGKMGKWTIVVGEREVEYWADDVLLGEQDIPTANGVPWLGASAPVFMMKYNTGNVSNTNTMRVARVAVSLLDVASNKPWSHVLAGMGQQAYQGQNGGTMGTTASLPNATTATTVTGTALSQTVANKTGLGGEAGIVAAVAGIDGIITAFQNPIGGINQTPRNLIITGIRIDSVNIGAAVATTASVLQWSLAYGAIIPAGTIPPLTQAETGSFVTATTKAYRRIALGIQSWIVGAGIGQAAEQITVKFDSPVVVHPGQWACSVAKFIVGTATASQVIWANVTFDAHYE
jgi:hypothetical protein